MARLSGHSKMFRKSDSSKEVRASELNFSVPSLIHWCFNTLQGKLTRFVIRLAVTTDVSDPPKYQYDAMCYKKGYRKKHTVCRNHIVPQLLRRCKTNDMNPIH